MAACVHGSFDMKPQVRARLTDFVIEEYKYRKRPRTVSTTGSNTCASEKVQTHGKAAEEPEEEEQRGLADSDKKEGDDKVVRKLRGLRMLKPRVPRQLNCCDCGVFACQYTEEIYCRWPCVTAANISRRIISEDFTPTMFSPQQIIDKRHLIRSKINELTQTQATLASTH